MDISSCKSANSRINMVKKKNNFRIIVIEAAGRLSFALSFWILFSFHFKVQV